MRYSDHKPNDAGTRLPKNSRGHILIVLVLIYPFVTVRCLPVSKPNVPRGMGAFEKIMKALAEWRRCIAVLLQFMREPRANGCQLSTLAQVQFVVWSQGPTHELR